MLQIIFEALISFLGGAIIQLYEDGKLSIKKAFLFVWFAVFLCFLCMRLLDGFPFYTRDLLLALAWSFLTASLCLVIFLIVQLLKKDRQ